MTPKNNDLLTSEYMLLGLLDQKPAHGYELFKRIADPDDVGMIWRVKMSNLYAQLNKLERDGLIIGTFQPGNLHPSRVEFTISDKGREMFEHWLTSIVTHPRDLRPVFLLKLFFMRERAEPDGLSTFINRQIGECEHWLEENQKSMQAVDAVNELKADLLSYRHLVIRSQVDWLKLLLDRT